MVIKMLGVRKLRLSASSDPHYLNRVIPAEGSDDIGLIYLLALIQHGRFYYVRINKLRERS